MIAGEDAEAAGVDGKRFVQAELGGKVSDRASTEDAGIGSAPGPVFLQVFLTAAVDVIDAAMEDELGGTALDFGERHFVEHGDRILLS